MSEIELEPDRNRLHDLVRLTYESAQSTSGVTHLPGNDGQRPGAVKDEDIAAAGPYSLEQIREHLTTEQEGTYVLEREGETLFVVGLQDS